MNDKTNAPAEKKSYRKPSVTSRELTASAASSAEVGQVGQQSASMGQQSQQMVVDPGSGGQSSQ